MRGRCISFLSLGAVLAFAAMSPAFAQRPSLSLSAGYGQWRAWVSYDENAYANDFKRWFSAAHLGAELDLAPSARAAFTLGAGVEYGAFEYSLTNLAGYRVDADLHLFSIDLSAGTRLEPIPNLEFRVALTTQLSCGTLGTYTSAYRSNDPSGWTEHPYADSLARLRRAINLGPSWSLGWRFPLRNGAAFEPRVTGALGLLSVFRAEAQAPHNPRIFRWSLGFAFTLPRGPAD